MPTRETTIPFLLAVGNGITAYCHYHSAENNTALGLGIIKIGPLLA